jgi:hypothetical protein
MLTKNFIPVVKFTIQQQITGVIFKSKVLKFIKTKHYLSYGYAF